MTPARWRTPRSEEFLQRLQNGEHPTVAEYVARFPCQEKRLKSVLPMLLIMEDVGSVAESSQQYSGPRIRPREASGSTRPHLPLRARPVKNA